MKTKKKSLFSLCLLMMIICVNVANAQEESRDEQQKGFKKEKLFTGGTIALGFSHTSFLAGASPVFGYSLTRWADAGILLNYTYSFDRDIYAIDDRLRETMFGGGAFVRLFPVRFLFAQAQVEHNWLRLKYLPAPGSYQGSAKQTGTNNSVLVGAGYATGRDPDHRTVYGTFAILFDVIRDKNSPYTDNEGRAVPVIRAGLHIPLFQGRSNDY